MFIKKDPAGNIKPDKEKIHPVYLMLYLQSEKGEEEMSKYANGGGMKTISIKDFHGEVNLGKYKVTHRTVKTNLFGNRSVHAYVTSNSKGSHRLFFCTASAAELHMSCAWHENSE